MVQFTFANLPLLSNVANGIALFEDAMVRQAAERVCGVLAQSLGAGPLGMAFSKTEQLSLAIDLVLVFDATVDLLLNDDVIRSALIDKGGAELLGQTIVRQQSELYKAREFLIETQAAFN